MPITGNENTIGISIAFIIMIVIMLWFIIGGKGKWWMKVPLIGFGVYISVVIWFAMNGLLGWATPSQLPDQFRVHWIVVEEPDEDGNEGGIYVWADDISKKKEEVKELSWTDKYLKPYVLPLHDMTDNGPRVYKIPYNRELHKQSREIQKFLMEGGVYRGTMKGEGLPGKGGQKGQGQGQGEGGEGRDGKGNGKNGKGPGDMSQEQVPHFYQLPPPKFPPKNEFMNNQQETQRPKTLWD